MYQAKINKQKKAGLEDINFPEFPLGICSERQPQKLERKLAFQDGNFLVYIEPSVHGFPTQFTRDILRTLIQMTFRRNHFSDRKVDLSIREILKEMRVAYSGPNSNSIKRHLDILAGTRIIFEDCFYSKADKEIIEKTVNMGIIQTFAVEKSKSKKKNDKFFKRNPDMLRSGIRWNEDFFNFSLKNSQNLINYDFDYYIALKGNITKELYLLLNKRSFRRNSLKIPLKVLAFEKIGISRTLEKTMFKVRQLVRIAHDELIKTGFLKYEPIFVKDGSVEWVEYQFSFQTQLDFVEDEEEPRKLEKKLAKKTNKNPEKNPEYFYQDYLKLDFLEDEIDSLASLHGRQKVRDILALYKLSKSTVQNPRKWIYAGLNNGFDMSELRAKKAQEEMTKQRLQSRAKNDQKIKQQEQEQAEEEEQINSLVDSWRLKNPEKYDELFYAYLDDFKQKDSNYYKFMMQQAKKKNLDFWDYVKTNRLFTTKLHHRIYNKYIKMT